MQENKKWYWERKNHQQFIIVPTCAILHPCLDVIAVKDINYIPKNVCNRSQAKRALQIYPVCTTDYYHENIPE